MIGPRARSAAVAALLAALGLAAGCELIVPGEPTNVHCTEEGAVGPPVCPMGSFCDRGDCRPGPPALGDPCAADDRCAAGDQCLDSESFNFTGPPICSRPCCSSPDCGAGTDLVCAVLGPGKMCLPAKLFGRAEPGTRFAGEPCTEGFQCRSGDCAAEGGYCRDSCCGDAECGLFDGACRDAGQGWMCAPAQPDTRPFPEPCQDASDCSSGICFMWPDKVARCADPCCSSEQCGEIKIGDGLRSILCVPITHGGTTIQACAAVAEGPADRAVGEPCDDPGQCRGGRCIEVEPATGNTASPEKMCSDVCCTDASCGAPHLFACTPTEEPASPQNTPAGTGLALQCTKR